MVKLMNGQTNGQPLTAPPDRACPQKQARGGRAAIVRVLAGMDHNP